jgi:hypothetical protein
MKLLLFFILRMNDILAIVFGNDLLTKLGYLINSL